MHWLILITLCIAPPLAAWVSRFGRLYAAAVAAAATLLAVAVLLSLSWGVLQGGPPLVTEFAWLPQVGLNLSFRLDGLGLLFSLLILGIGLLIILYARYYLASKDCMGRFYAYLMLFMGAMLGIALSENIIQMLIFWELTSLSSFLLISYWQDRPDARNGARMALAITGAGGLALLGGFLLLGEITGSYDLSVILASGDVIRAHELYRPMLVLILLGAFTKSAQFPFHFWLPNAMAAPTPVSAYLHSATMVKAGVFLLARLFPALSGTPEWGWLVGGAGLATLILGAVVALFQDDLKGLLAYSTISHLGLITLLFGIGTPLAAVAGVFHIINHATFKASLFMAAGIIDHETGTRSMTRLSGLWRYMPITGGLAIVASAAMAGVPLVNGFLSKEMFFAEAVEVAEHAPYGWLLPVAVTLAGAFAVAYSVRFIHDVFWGGEPQDLPKSPHEPHERWMLAPVGLLVVACVVVGIAPALVVEPLLKVAAAGLLQGPIPEFSLAIWHGFNLALWMSLLALVGGVLLYGQRNRLTPIYDWFASRLQGEAIFQASLRGLFALAVGVSSWLEGGRLRPTWGASGAGAKPSYWVTSASLPHLLLMLLITTLVLGFSGLWRDGGQLDGGLAFTPLDPISLVVGLALILATFACLRVYRNHYLALLLLGVVGLVVALTFARFSAPDLALTQLSVEVVTVVLLLLALFFLPQHGTLPSSRPRLWRDGVMAALAGLGVSLASLAVLTRPNQGISDFYMDQALPGGGGTNVVNVILVDFRGFDTLGEVTVLALAALGIVAMLQRLPPGKLQAPEVDDLQRPWDRDLHPPVVATLSRLLLPLALLVAVFILLRGHNLPGGGFIAGLITAVALIMQYLGNGVVWTEERLPKDKHWVVTLGLAIAVVTGLVSMFLGAPFLTSAFTHVDWPLVGEFELASAMAFDLGVFLVVVGATLLILVRLGRIHDASHSAAPVPARPPQEVY